MREIPLYASVKVDRTENSKRSQLKAENLRTPSKDLSTSPATSWAVIVHCWRIVSIHRVCRRISPFCRMHEQLQLTDIKPVWHQKVIVRLRNAAHYSYNRITCDKDYGN